MLPSASPKCDTLSTSCRSKGRTKLGSGLPLQVTLMPRHEPQRYCSTAPAPPRWRVRSAVSCCLRDPPASPPAPPKTLASPPKTLARPRARALQAWRLAPPLPPPRDRVPPQRPTRPQKPYREAWPSQGLRSRYRSPCRFFKRYYRPLSVPLRSWVWALPWGPLRNLAGGSGPLTHRRGGSLQASPMVPQEGSPETLVPPAVPLLPALARQRRSQRFNQTAVPGVPRE